MVAAFVSVTSARAETFSCSFGDSTGVAFHQGNWKSGSKAGSLAIVYQTQQSPAHAAREAQGDPKLESILIEAGFGKQIVTTWGPAATAVEVTTISGQGQRRAAVRSVQVLALADAPSVTIDHGTCEVAP